MVIDGKNTICDKFLGKERERELEGEKETRGEREKRENGAGSPVFIFLADLGTLERRGSRLNVAELQILPFADLKARWSAESLARACLHAGAQGAALRCGS